MLVIVGLVLRASGAGQGSGRVALLPWFMVLFLALVALGSVVDLPAALVEQVKHAAVAHLSCDGHCGTGRQRPR